MSRVESSHIKKKKWKSIPCKDNGTGSLNIIVKALVVIAIPVEVIERLLALEILKLHDHVRIDVLGGRHELVHELLLLGNRRPLGTQAEVEGILQVGLVGGSAIQDNGEGLLGVDTGCGGIQG